MTADTRLWHLAVNHVGTNEIDIAAIKPRRLDGMSYVCYMLAKDIVTGSRTVAVTDLADPSLMSSKFFMVSHAHPGLWADSSEPAYIQNIIRPCLVSSHLLFKVI